jgi:hypothetical protein
MEHAEHPSRDLLERFMEAKVSREEVRQVVRHLLTDCSICAEVIAPLWRRSLSGIEEADSGVMTVPEATHEEPGETGDMEKASKEELSRIVETLRGLRNDLEVLRTRLSESCEPHAVIGCCLLDRFDPMVAELKSLL